MICFSGLEWELRGPTAILFILRDTCCDSIEKLFGTCFYWGIAQLSCDLLQNGVSHRCACVKLSSRAGYRTILGTANLPEKVSRDMGYRSDSIAKLRDMGPLRVWGCEISCAHAILQQHDVLEELSG